MKYKSLLALAAASLTMAFACQKPVDLGPEKVVIDSEATHEFPVEGGEYTLQLTATVDWTLQGYDESVKNWLSISPSSGTASADPQTITIKALPNEGADRKADIVFYGNVMNKAPLTITQKGDLVEDGTAEHPYSVATALRLIDENGWTGNDNVSETVYVKGIVSTGIDDSDFDPEKYGNATYKISDGEGMIELEVYRGYYLGGEKFTSLDQLKVGDEVVVYGKLTRFFQTYEVTQGSELYSHNGQTAEGGGDEPEELVEPTSATKVTIDEFLDKPVNNTDWYELTGTIINIVSGNAYGNFTIEDETGSVYIYGMVQAWAGGKNDKSFNNIGLEVGDIVTLWSLRDEYDGEPQGGGSDIPAIYKSHEDGVPVTYPEGTVFLTFPDDNSDNNKVNGYDEPWTAMSGEYSFTMTQFNNYEWNNWTYVRCGRKNGPSVASIATVNAMPALASVEVVANKLNSDKVNSIVLSVYSDAGMANQLGQDIAPEGELEAGTLEFVVPADIVAENLYYKLTFDCAKGDGNGFVEIGKVTYIAAE